MKSFFSIHLDSLGFFTSMLCAVHCILAPVLILLLPTVLMFSFTNEVFESLIIGLSIIFACSSLIRSFLQKHRNAIPIIIALSGIILLIFTHVIHLDVLEVVFSVAGGLFIAFAHIKNWQLSGKHVTKSKQVEYSISKLTEPATPSRNQDSIFEEQK